LHERLHARDERVDVVGVLLDAQRRARFPLLDRGA
jgi:hypothetical protein